MQVREQAVPCPFVRRGSAILAAAALLAVACGGESRPAPSEGVVAEETHRADSLAAEVERLKAALAEARAAARRAQTAEESSAAPSGPPAGQGEAGDTAAAPAFRGPAAAALAGAGLLRFPGERGAGITYVGELRDGRANGYGYAVWTTGSAYEGRWRDNRRHGPGRHQYPDGAVYEGLYADDLREGQGTYHYKNGQRWEGPWQGNLRHGEGVLYEADGRVRVRGVWERDRLVREIKG